jgi:hypothetical protein
MSVIGDVYEKEFSDGTSLIKGYCTLLAPRIELCEILGRYYIDKEYSLVRVTKKDLETYNLRQHFTIKK